MPSVLFLADQFCDSTRTEHEVHPGGAELTDDAAIAACPWPVTRGRIASADPAKLSSFDLIVVGNAQRAAPALLEAVARTGRHVLFEHDVRICRYSGNFPSATDPLHRSAQRCWCHRAPVHELLRTALGVIFLTKLQRSVYADNPFFVPPPSVVLGCSLFSERFLERADRFRGRAPDKRGTAVVYSINYIKGYERSLQYAQRLGGPIREARNVPLDELLDIFEASERFVYLPSGLEPAGRMPVEARLLGCEVMVNGHVGVAGEPWWRISDRSAALAFLQAAPRRFWRLVEDLANGAVQPVPAMKAEAWRALARMVERDLPQRAQRVAWPVLSPRALLRTLAIHHHPAW